MGKNQNWRRLSKSPKYSQNLFWSSLDVWNTKVEEYDQIYYLKNRGFEFNHVLDERLIEIIESKFEKLQAYEDNLFDLEFLEQNFPIPYLFISPRKHAIILYSIYRAAIGSNMNQENMAIYEEFVSYIFKGDFPEEFLIEFYYFYYNTFRIIKMLTPFRRLFGLETGKKHYKNKKIISQNTIKNLKPLLSTPSDFTITIKKLMKSKGFGISLAFTFKVARLSEHIGKKIKKFGLTKEFIEEFTISLNDLYNWYLEQIKTKNKNEEILTILSIAHMSERNICIAGIFDNSKWGRLIYHNEKLPVHILKEKGLYFSNFDRIRLSILSRKQNTPFIEDCIINWTRKPKILFKIPFEKREAYLTTSCENSILKNHIKKNKKIGNILLSLNKSLILVGPIGIKCALFKKGIVKKFQARIQYSILNPSFTSEDSISCTDKLWRKFGQILLSTENLNSITFNGKDLENIFGLTKFFVVIGLSREFRGKYWELIVGIHTIPDLNKIINQLNQGSYIDKLNQFLSKHLEDSIIRINKIPINLNQRNFPILIRKKISDILQEFDTNPSKTLYQLIELYENELRSYIKAEISSTTPKQWYRKHIEPLFDESKVGRIDSKFTQDRSHKYKHIYNHPNPLIYVNLEDLRLITSHVGMKRFFINFNEITYNYMKEIENYRNAILHYRPIMHKEDLVFFVIKIFEYFY